MKIHFTTLDVFTSTRYRGNPLAIVLPPTPDTLTQTQKQTIANEFNLSESVILHLPPNTSTSPPNELTIDIFTSQIEIPFAGHPTIGSAFFVLNYLGLESVTTLITKAGRIPLSRVGGRVRAEIPFDVHVHGLKTACPLQASPSEQQPPTNPTFSIVNGMAFTYVSLPDLATLARAHETANLHKDTYDVAALDEGWRKGLVGTMYYVFVGEESGTKRYRTRMFGTEEDPGTGSASAGLGCWLALQGEGEGKGEGKGKGKREYRFAFEQGVEMGRRNDIFVDVDVEEKEVKKVWLSGEAVKVMEGELEI